MQLTEFAVCMEELKKAFGEKVYTEPRIKGIWVMVRNLPDGWFHEVLPRLTLLKDAPLGKDFRESIETYYRSNNTYRPDNVGGHCSLSPDTVREFVDTTVKMIGRRASREEWDNFIQYIDDTVDAEKGAV